MNFNVVYWLDLADHVDENFAHSVVVAAVVDLDFVDVDLDSVDLAVVDSADVGSNLSDLVAVAADLDFVVDSGFADSADAVVELNYPVDFAYLGLTWSYSLIELPSYA